MCNLRANLCFRNTFYEHEFEVICTERFKNMVYGTKHKNITFSTLRRLFTFIYKSTNSYIRSNTFMTVLTVGIVSNLEDDCSPSGSSRCGRLPILIRTISTKVFECRPQWKFPRTLCKHTKPVPKMHDQKDYITFSQSVFRTNI